MLKDNDIDVMLPNAEASQPSIPAEGDFCLGVTVRNAERAAGRVGQTKGPTDDYLCESLGMTVYKKVLEAKFVFDGLEFPKTWNRELHIEIAVYSALRGVLQHPEVGDLGANVGF